MTRVCHLTSVHSAMDTRIFLKECRSLAANGYEVFLVANHAHDERRDGVQIIAVSRLGKGRLNRILFYVWKIFRAALATKSDIYHFHDPELFLPAALMRIMGKKVIFDIHENVARQLKVKEYLPMRFLVSRLYGIIDFLSSKLFYLVLAETSYCKIYERFGADNTVVLNMPDIGFLQPYVVTERPLETQINLFYVGGISFDRGIDVVIKALHRLKAAEVPFHFHCVGPMETAMGDRVRSLEVYPEVAANITFYGTKRLDDAFELSKKCHIGLSILRPIENYLESYSTKIFEYMAVGLPVITSNFELYRNVIEKHGTGFCIDPGNHVELSDRIIDMAENAELRANFCKNGISASREYYNWQTEKKKLLELYARLS